MATKTMTIQVDWGVVRGALRAVSLAEYAVTHRKDSPWPDPGEIKSIMDLADLWLHCSLQRHKADKEIHDFHPSWGVIDPKGWITDPLHLSYLKRAVPRAMFSPDPGKSRSQVRPHDHFRALLAWALALGDLQDTLAEALGGKTTSHDLCIVRDGLLYVSGVNLYLECENGEGNDAVPIDAIRDFVGGGSLENLRERIRQ